MYTAGLALTLTEEAMFFSFLCRVERLLETSSRVVVPSSEPQAMKHPVSWTRRQKSGSSHTCRRSQQNQVELGKKTKVTHILLSDPIGPHPSTVDKDHSMLRPLVASPNVSLAASSYRSPTPWSPVSPASGSQLQFANIG